MLDISNEAGMEFKERGAPICETLNIEWCLIVLRMCLNSWKRCLIHVQNIISLQYLWPWRRGPVSNHTKFRGRVRPYFRCFVVCFLDRVYRSVVCGITTRELHFSVYLGNLCYDVIVVKETRLFFRFVDWFLHFCWFRFLFTHCPRLIRRGWFCGLHLVCQKL